MAQNLVALSQEGEALRIFPERIAAVPESRIGRIPPFS